MPVNTDVVPRVSYTGDGVVVAFPYPWLILNAGDLRVYVNSVLQPTTAYTVTGVGTSSGGNVTFPSPPPSVSVVIIRHTAATQLTRLADTGPAAMTAIQTALDRLTMLVQEANEVIGRTPALSLFSTFRNLTLADPVAGFIPRWNPTLTGLENIDPSTVIPAGEPLPLTRTKGGTSATTAIGARQAFGLDGQVRKVLTNRTGGPLTVGAVVTHDANNDSAVRMGDTVSSKAQAWVALETILDTIPGEFLLAGVGLLAVPGPVVRGHYLRKSATALMAEDSGVAQGVATDPPQGAFAVALAADSGGLVLARMFGSTYPGSAGAPVISGLGRVVGLTGVNNSGTPNSQYDFAATQAVVRDASGGGTLVLPTVATRTLDITVSGPAAGGRDQAGAFSANTWVHCYLIAKPDGTYHVTASLSAPATGPVLPTGYTLATYLGALRINNSSQLVRTRLQSSKAWYMGKQIVIADGAAVVETAVSLAAFMPPTATNAVLFCRFYADTSVYKLRLRLETGVDWLDNSLGAASTADLPGQITLPNVAQQFFYIWAAYAGATTGLYADCVGYENPL